MGKGSDFCPTFGWESGSWFQLMGISKGEQGIAEGGKLVIIKRTWETQNNVRATSCRGSGASGGNRSPPLQCSPFKQRASPIPTPPSLVLPGGKRCCVLGSPFLPHQHLFLPFLHNLNSPSLSLRKANRLGGGFKSRLLCFLSELFNLSEPQCPHPTHGDNNEA